MKKDFCLKLIESHDSSFYNLTFIGSVMEILGKKDSSQNVILREVFYDILETINVEEELSKTMEEILIMSDLLLSKVNKMGEKKEDYCNQFYNSYIRLLLLNYANGNINLSRMIFITMMEAIKVDSGYYGFSGDIGYCDAGTAKKYGSMGAWPC